MNIRFESVIIHGFKSFGDATIRLSDMGYTLVSGINNRKSDNATSNGSGKSSWIDAIVWALSGETASGISKGLVNLYSNDGMYVILYFTADNKKFQIIRAKNSKEYGTNLQIYIDGEDKSGKGIRDSEQLLQQYLPDLTKSLIGSVIILGQGLPQRFSNNTASGRKEILEKLSRSDFMIADLKDRIKERKEKLDSDLRNVQDLLLVKNTNLAGKTDLLQKVNTELSNMQDKTELDNILSQYIEQEKNIKAALDSNLQAQAVLEGNLNKEDADNNNLYQQKCQYYSDNATKQNIELADIADKTKEDINDAFNMVQDINYKLKIKEAELKKAKTITDVCPTCGQKLPGVFKPDLTPYETAIENLKKEKADTDKLYSDLTTDKTNKEQAVISKYKQELENYTADWNQKVNAITNQKEKDKADLVSVRATLSTINSDLSVNQASKAKIQTIIDNYMAKADNLNQQKVQYTKDIENINEEIRYNMSMKENLNAHISAISKMNTSISRDFRGYLLSNVVTYIDKQAKIYAQEILDSSKIDFSLSGNDIAITYDSKAIECLSGGERQKVDLIIQFALRDMLCQYMNFSSNLLVIDEGFDALDSIGCQYILNMIANKLSDIESIFIISHHTDSLDIPADNELVIIKNNEGISSIRE